MTYYENVCSWIEVYSIIGGKTLSCEALLQAYDWITYEP